MVPGEGRGVVGASGDSHIPSVILVADDISLGNQSSLLKVTVGEPTVGVGVGHHFRLDPTGERGSPEDGGVALREDHTTHTSLGSIHSAQDSRGIRYNLSQASGALQ